MKITTPWYILVFLYLSIHSTQTNNNLCLDCSPIKDSDFRIFCMPIEFTEKGINFYLEKVYTHPGYGQEFLPHNLTHIIDFIQQANINPHGSEFMYSSLRLLNNKVKTCPYISGYAYQHLSEHLPTLLKCHCAQRTFAQEMQQAIKDILYNSFLTDFSLFQEQPDNFFEQLIKKINQTIGINQQEAVNREQLRQLILRLQENCLSKLIWSPHDQELVWTSFKTITANLESLLNEEIITIDELDDLYISLIESFCRFLDLTGAHLSPAVVEKMKTDIVAQDLAFCLIEEQEEYLETKSERLMRQIVKTEAIIQARQHGIITEK